jgi:membrane-bound metal-dependent hydrolase YbcI (DUF457 family)
MIAGHFGFAAAVKSRVPAAPTWALMLASVWMDVIFVPLFVAGIETMEPFGGGDGQAYGAAIIHADWTHSLLGALVIAASFGLVCALPWGKKVGAVLGAVVFSHWVLDLPMHHHDMPLLPGNAGHLPLLGFGLWSFPAAAALLELVIVGVGTWLYWKKAAATEEAAGASTRPARVAAIAMAVSGVVTLALNLAGL